MPPPFTEKSAETFWMFVKKPANPDACWPWEGNLNMTGLPTVRWKEDDGKRYCTTATRLSWAIHRGQFPSSRLGVVTNCGMRRCVNPKHLTTQTMQKLAVSGKY